MVQVQISRISQDGCKLTKAGQVKHLMCHSCCPCLGPSTSFALRGASLLHPTSRPEFLRPVLVSRESPHCHGLDGDEVEKHGGQGRFSEVEKIKVQDGSQRTLSVLRGFSEVKKKKK